jgi:hypothetical protein
MLKTLLMIAGALVVLVAALQLWRWTDMRAADAAWERLAAARADLPVRFDAAMIAGLPEPAQRFLRFTILPGSRLGTAVEIRMGGQLSLGTKDDPRYQPMRAHQILVPAHGLVWRLDAGRSLMRVVGSDGMEADRSWVRFWWMGVAPVVRAGGNPDHLRAAFGRVVAEAAFWAPAALLPQNGVAWDAVDADTARATMTHRGMTQSVDIRVDEEGRPLWVMIERWTDANPAGQFRLQPFGGYLSDFREVDGYRLPFQVEGGNFFGTDDYYPFYKAEVEEIRVLANAAAPWMTSLMWWRSSGPDLRLSHRE